jgi:hypothetical protein
MGPRKQCPIDVSRKQFDSTCQSGMLPEGILIWRTVYSDFAKWSEPGQDGVSVLDRSQWNQGGTLATRQVEGTCNFPSLAHCRLRRSSRPCLPTVGFYSTEPCSCRTICSRATTFALMTAWSSSKCHGRKSRVSPPPHPSTGTKTGRVSCRVNAHRGAMHFGHDAAIHALRSGKGRSLAFRRESPPGNSIMQTDVGPFPLSCRDFPS